MSLVALHAPVCNICSIHGGEGKLWLVVCVWVVEQRQERKGKLGTNAMERVSAGAHLPTPWLFEPAKRPDDGASFEP